MKTKFIGCEVLKNELLCLGVEQVADCEFFSFDLHSDVDKLHQTIQETIDQNQEYERIILGYSRCSSALLGLHSAKAQLVFPTTHDCVGFALGSTKRHLECIDEAPGTFYITQGFLDYAMNPYQRALEYVETYGEKKAKRLIKLLYGAYTRGLFITTPGIPNEEAYEEYLARSKEITEYFGWRLEKTEGDSSLMQALLWDGENDEVIRLPGGCTITNDLFDNSVTITTQR